MEGDTEPVRLAGVTKWFGDATALDGVDLQVTAGAIHGIVGPNGAGKTTLLAVLFGLVLPDEGEVRLFGRTRSEAGAAWLDGVGGFVESPRFYPYLTGRANLSVLAGLDDVGDGHADARWIDEVVGLVGIDEAVDRKVRGYSLGMRQRLGVAASLLRRPRLLILDEPTNGMDPTAVRDLMATLRKLVSEGVTVLLSSQDMHHVEALCDVVTVINRGENVWSGPLQDMRARAPDPTWHLETSDDRAALSLAARLTGVAARSGDAGGLFVRAGQPHLDRYVLALAEAGVAVRGLALESAALETFLLQLTGGHPDAAVTP